MRARDILFSGESLPRLSVGGAGDRWRLANRFALKVFQGGERAQRRQLPSCHGVHVVRPGSVSVRDHVECVYGPHVRKRRGVVWKRQGLELQVPTTHMLGLVLLFRNRSHVSELRNVIPRGIWADCSVSVNHTAHHYHHKIDIFSC